MLKLAQLILKGTVNFKIILTLYSRKEKNEQKNQFTFTP